MTNENDVVLDGPVVEENYFKRYWKDKGTSINVSRKQRYETDEEYAAKMRKYSQDYRDKKRLERASRPRQQHVERVNQQQITYNGKSLKLFGVKVFAKMLGLPIERIHYWRKVGMLPDSPFVRSVRRDRMYTQEMMEVVKHAIERRDQVRKRDQTFLEEIMSGWIALGVPLHTDNPS